MSTPKGWDTQLRHLQSFTGSSRHGRTSPQEDLHEATRRPSEAISVRHATNDQSRKIEIEFEPGDRIVIRCRECQTNVTKILDLLDHRCPDNTVQSPSGQ